MCSGGSEACKWVGEVRGSLARAGKVSGQTPRAAKREKTKSNRAKQGMQCRLHFVNVVPTFGQKKGPNAHSQVRCNSGVPQQGHSVQSHTHTQKDTEVGSATSLPAHFLC